MQSSPVLIKQAEHEDENWALFYTLLTDIDVDNFLALTQTIWRVIPIEKEQTVREYESKQVKASFHEFSLWVKGSTLSESSAFAKIPTFISGEVAVYADYKYFHELFSHSSGAEEEISSRIEADGQKIMLVSSRNTGKNRQNIKNSPHEVPIPLIDWSLHDTEVDAEGSTFWLGSRGAHTPLHYGMWPIRRVG